MEIGRIQWRIKCPKCSEEFWTYDPEKKVPRHEAKGTTTLCGGSEEVGTVIDRRIQPKIK
jgi:hypothetical protein